MGRRHVTRSRWRTRSAAVVLVCSSVAQTAGREAVSPVASASVTPEREAAAAAPTRVHTPGEAIVPSVPVEPVATPTRAAEEATAQPNVDPESLALWERSLPRTAELRRTADGVTWHNDDGSMSTRVYDRPVNFRDAQGEWRAIDTRLEATGEGGFVNRAGPVSVRFAGSSSDSRLVSLSTGAARLAIGFDGALGDDGQLAARARARPARRKPAAGERNAVAYEGILPGVRLEYALGADRLKELLVLDRPLQADAAPTFRFSIATDGLSPRLQDDGSIDLLDGGDVARVSIPPGVVFDSARDKEHPFGALAAVRYRLAERDGGWFLYVDVDQEWLVSPDRVYPVFIDPTYEFVDVPTGSDASVSALEPDSNYEAVYDPNSERYVNVAGPLFGAEAMSFLEFGSLDLLDGQTIESAQWHGYAAHGLGFPSSFTLDPVNAAWAADTVTWNNRPGVIANEGRQGQASGAGEWATVDITEWVENWAGDTWDSRGIRITAPDFIFFAAEEDSASFRSYIEVKFHQVGYYDTVMGDNPAMYWRMERPSEWDGDISNEIPGRSELSTFDTSTAAGALFGDENPSLYGETGHSGYVLGWPSPVGTDEFSLEWWFLAGSVAEDGWFFNRDLMFRRRGFEARLLDGQLQGLAYTSGDFPAERTAVTSPERYDDNKWHYAVFLYDSEAEKLYLYVDAALVSETPLADVWWDGFAIEEVVLGGEIISGNQPYEGFYDEIASYDYALSPEQILAHYRASVDPSAAFGPDPYADAGLGNFVWQATDAKVLVVGPPLELERTYNSLDERVGSFGRGWSSSFEMSAEVDAYGTNVTVVQPDGRRELYRKQPDGSYAPPEGYFSTLEGVAGGGWKLTSKDRSEYVFDSDGRLTSIEDANGRAVALSYDASDRLETVSDMPHGLGGSPSGRSLTFGYSGSDTKVSSVSTSPVTGPDLDGMAGADYSGALTWSYHYDGDLLDKVCDPRSTAQVLSCYDFDYQGGRVSKITKPEGNIEVEVHYNSAGKIAWTENGVGNRITRRYPAPGVAEVTDARGNTVTTEYDELWRTTKITDPYGNETTYEYDERGFRSRVEDPNHHVTNLVYDDRGNLLRTTNQEGETTYYTYNGDDLIDVRDPRSSSGTDDTYKTTYDYDAAGNMVSEQLPATDLFDPGVSRSWTYTSGSEAACGSPGTQPPGLKKTAVDFRGSATTYCYDAAGNLREETAENGRSTSYTYDELGREISETIVSDTFSSGVTSTTSYDQLSNVVEEVAPATTNEVSSVEHQARIRYVYDRNARLTSQTVSDVLGGDAARTTTYTYDDADRVDTTEDPAGGIVDKDYDPVGNVEYVTDAEGRKFKTVYDRNNRPTGRWLTNFENPVTDPGNSRAIRLEAMTYDPAGRKITSTDAQGRVRHFDYWDDDRLKLVWLESYHNRDQSTGNVVIKYLQYDAAGHTTIDMDGFFTRWDANVYDEAGWLTSTDRKALGAVYSSTSFEYDENQNLTLQRTIDPTDQNDNAEIRYAYAPDADVLTTMAVENGSDDLVTTWTYDERDLPLTMVDPNGNAGGADPADYRTTYVHDELGRRIATVAPETTVVVGTGAPAAVEPTSVVGYDTFGNVTHRQDPNGNVTTTSYDTLDRVDVITQPTYTDANNNQLAPTEDHDYDQVGNLTAYTDRRGETIEYTFDSLNRVVRKLDPAVGTDPRGAITYAYDDVGNQVSRTDQNGARTEWTYDDLDRVRHETAIVRQDDQGQGPGEYTTTYDYDDIGRQAYRQTPSGAEWVQTWSAADEVLTRTDPLDNVTNYTYTVRSQLESVTDPLGRRQTRVYDPAGRQSAIEYYEATPTLLATEHYGYDANGNQTSYTAARGNAPGATPADFTTEYRYDPTDRLTEVVEPLTGADQHPLRLGYDAVGNLTRVTDGNDNTTIYDYNAWNQREKTTEPSTIAYPNLADRQWVRLFDKGGLPVEDREPGGVTVTRTFDELGRLTSETGAGTGVATATRTFGYDAAGNRTRIGTPSGDLTLAWDDRDLLRSSTGVTDLFAAYAYDESGRATVRWDTSTVTTFTWTDRDELDTATDSLTGTSHHYLWDDAGQLDKITEGAGAEVTTRDYSYNDRGWLNLVVLTHPDGTNSAAQIYDYDVDGNVVLDWMIQPGGTVNTYTYDHAGRLASWTPFGQPTVDYGYDLAGNRKTAGNASYDYDERNRLTDADGTAYAFTARGTLAGTDDGTVTSYDFDGLGRLVDADGQHSYSYDSLDRLVTRDGMNLAYAGTEIDPVSDGAVRYARTPGGDLLALQDGANPPVVVGENRHGDLSYTFDPGAGTITDSRIYDPYGVTLSQSGPNSPALGYQSDYTDPDTEQVWMGARWYQPGTGTFTARDTVFGQLRSPVSLNRYTYANGDPLQYFDPDGRFSLGGLGRAIGSVAHGAGSAVRSAASWTNEHVVRPAASAVRGAASWTNEHVIQPVYHTVRDRVINPVVNAVKAGASAVEDFVVQPLVAGSVKAYKTYGAPVVQRTQRVVAAAARTTASVVQTAARTGIAAVRQCIDSDTCRRVAAVAAVATVGVATGGTGAALLGAGIGIGFGALTCQGDIGCIADSGIAGAAGGLLLPGAAASTVRYFGQSALAATTAEATSQFTSGHFNAAHLAIAPAAGVTLASAARYIPRLATRSTPGRSFPEIDTPHRVARQHSSPGALAARQEVGEGATVWRTGTTGRSQASEAQFWTTEHPSTPGFAQRYGIPPENVANADFIESAVVRPGSPFVTRPAPGVGPNAGGGIEVVVPEGGVRMCGFSWIGPKGGC